MILRLFTTTFICIVCLTSLLQQLSANDTRLLSKQDVALVLPAAPSSELQLAISDLKSFLQRTLQVQWHEYGFDSRAASVAEPICIVVQVGDNRELEIETSQLGPEDARVVGKVVGTKTVLALTGKTPKAAAYAIYSFLEKELGVGFFIDGDRIPHLDSAPIAPIDRTEKPAVPIRGLFFHHVWKHPHAHCWRLWDFDGWKQAIDWMRRKRFNTMPLFHDSGEYMWGDVIFDAFPQIPKNESTLADYVVDPTWRTNLNKKIIAYVRQSGLKVAYNLFYSQVPVFFRNSYPHLRYHELAMANLGINADQPECKELIKQYWKKLIDTYGVDDSHVYLVCSYRHERTLGEGFTNKNQPTLDAVSVLKEIDPKAQIYIETWCWKYRDEKVKTWETLDANPGLEWRDFDRGIPKDIGVVEWDVRRMHSRDMPKGFNGRPYIQLVHSTMEGWWPPSTLRNHPQWIIDYMNYSIENGANGLLYFHIQANTNDLLADLGAEIGMVGRPDLRTYYRDYARRRFGAKSADVVAESIEAFCDAVDFGQNRETSPQRMFLALAPPGFFNSAEDVLMKCDATSPADRKRWIEERLAIVRSKLPRFYKALSLARSVAPQLHEETYFKQYLWELDYVASRFEGIENMYTAHLLADVDPKQAQQRFDRAMFAFQTFKELFRDRPGIRMSELKSLEPNVPFTESFLKDWETRGYWEGSPQTATNMHVIWERFDKYEAAVRAMLPRELSK